MNGDSRGWRIALVPDTLVNPPPEIRAVLPDVLSVLEASGYGVLQLPRPGAHRLLLAVIADQLAEYAHHGYAVVAIGVRGEPGDGLHWRGLAPLLRIRGMALPPRHIIRPDVPIAVEEQRLAALLAGYDLPAEEQRRWRV
ncbi:MAG TPA: hypothetical protein VGO37_16655 [Steroidobacteraceae bacterium]|nr:hypothetical protein [Steroidobacteraceae bacterium]